MNIKYNEMWILRVMSSTNGWEATDDFLFNRRDEVDPFLEAFRSEARQEGSDCQNAYWLLGPIQSGMNIGEADHVRLDDNGRRRATGEELHPGCNSLKVTFNSDPGAKFLLDLVE